MIDKIPRQPLEIILDQIVLILNQEIPNQNTLSPGEGLNASIYKSRITPIQASECPAIIVDIAADELGMKTQISNDGTLSYNIDIFNCGKYTDDIRGDQIAKERLHRLVGVVKFIFMSSTYTTLGFERPFIGHVEISNTQFAVSNKSDDSNSVVVARLVLSVKVDSEANWVDPVMIAGFDTQALINGTIYGHIFSGDNVVPPEPPICADGEVRDERGIVLKEVASGGFVVMYDSLIKNEAGDTIATIEPEGEYTVLDGTATNSDGTYTLEVPSGGNVPIANTDVTIKDQNGLELGSESLPSGVAKEIDIDIPDGEVVDSEGTVGAVVPYGETIKLSDNIVRVSWGSMTQDINVPAFGDVVINFPTI